MKNKLRGIVAAGLLVLSFAGVSLAQENLGIYPYDTARFLWDYQTNAEWMIEGFGVSCGTSSGDYSLFDYRIADPTAREMLVKAVVPTQGTYYCAAYTYNDRDSLSPSPYSNEVQAVVINLLIAPTGFRITGSTP